MVDSKAVPSLKRIIMMDEDTRPGTVTFSDTLLAGSGLQVTVIQLEYQKVLIQSELGEIKKKVKMDDAVNIQFTSGTTGNPKVYCNYPIIN